MGNEQSKLSEEEKEAKRMQGYIARDREIAALAARKNPSNDKSEAQNTTAYSLPNPGTHEIKREPDIPIKSEDTIVGSRQPTNDRPDPSHNGPAPRMKSSIFIESDDESSLFVGESDKKAERAPTPATDHASRKRSAEPSARPPENGVLKRSKTDEMLQRPGPDTGNKPSAPNPPRIPTGPARTRPTNERNSRPNAEEAYTVPDWYASMARPTNRRERNGDIDSLLGNIKSRITTLLTRPPTDARIIIAEYDKLRENIHKATFARVNERLLRGNRMLDATSGLPAIFAPTQSPSQLPQFPWDLRADARELCNKWARRDFDGDLLRGLVLGVKDGRTSDSLDPKYQYRVDAKVFGSNGLANGQWWPTQLCALRDGAHGVSQGGIAGINGQGATSCIMSGGNDYPDKDEGTVVLYCGTDSADGEEPTAATALMLLNVKNGKPVRFMRSHNIPKTKSEHAPEVGLRYDGLYDVVSVELLDRSRKRYRFKMVRQEGQDPIRSGGRAGSRPNPVEVAEFKKDKRLRKG